MNATISSAAWAAHDVGLAASIGGTLFGRAVLQPALAEITSPAERLRVSAEAWQRFSLLNLVAHGVFAATWLAGRRMLSGREVSRTARRLTKVKDGLMIASLVSGVSSILLGRKLAKRIDRGAAREQLREANASDAPLQRTVGALGMLNLVTNIAIASITSILGMQANKSVRFAPRSRLLP